MDKWTLVCHSDHGDGGIVSVIQADNNRFNLRNIETTGKTNLQPDWLPRFLGVNANNQAIILNPETLTTECQAQIAADVFPAYAYRDDANQRMWFMNDGDKNGIDHLHCDNASTVTVVKREDSAQALKTLCVGRGHHVPVFLKNRIAYVSNLLDGTIVVIDNDENSEQFLNIIHSIDLTETDKEKNGTTTAPNNAFPHGMVYSSVTDRVYNLNNGYGTIVVINPETHIIEDRIALDGCSNLLLSPCGKFLIGKGADRKSNNEHVLGKLCVVDIEKQTVVTDLQLQDVYPSVYRFSADGKKLYVTTAATGKGAQKDNLIFDTLYVYDTTQLPNLPLLKSIKVGVADCGRRPIAFTSDGSHVFNPNPSDGSMSIIDGKSDEIIEVIDLQVKTKNELNFSFWLDGIYGA
ncbi:MAG: hypothetical protein OEZ58_06525 [Gammaproteobacteria bacterium]|nr:hypothetical protein [Gammaproteobacteria bacterium]MDH5728626.1 hypothetical protein [Gammaproteobacteria bacterium]